MEASQATHPPLDVTHLIDSGGVTASQVTAIALCGAVAFLDGMDTQSMALVAPMILVKLGLTGTAYGPIISAAHLGAMTGAFTFGALADRFGRKTMLIAASSIFGLFTLASALADSYAVLLAIRFCAGVGLGGATPCFIALATEYAPARRRASVVSLIWAAFPLGGMVGGFLSAWLLTQFSWHAVFGVGGLLPLAVAAGMYVWLPESIRFLLARGGSPDRIAAILRRIRPGLPRTANIVVSGQVAPSSSILDLFGRATLPTTLILWVPFVAAFGTLTVAVSWTPLLLRQHGFAPALTAVVIGFHGLGALIGNASAGRLMERFGMGAVLVPSLLLGAGATAMLGYAAGSVVSMSMCLASIGLFVGMAASGSIAVASTAYPTSLRSTGVGWAMGIGRLGQVVFPLLLSAGVAADWPEQDLFPVIGLALVLGAIAVLFLRQRLSRPGRFGQALGAQPVVHN